MHLEHSRTVPYTFCMVIRLDSPSPNRQAREGSGAARARPETVKESGQPFGRAGESSFIPVKDPPRVKVSARLPGARLARQRGLQRALELVLAERLLHD